MTEVHHLEIAEPTWNRWPNQYGGMNTKLLAEDELAKTMLKELA